MKTYPLLNIECPICKEKLTLDTLSENIDVLIDDIQNKEKVYISYYCQNCENEVTILSNTLKGKIVYSSKAPLRKRKLLGTEKTYIRYIDKGLTLIFNNKYYIRCQLAKDTYIVFQNCITTMTYVYGITGKGLYKQTSHQ